MKQFDSSPAASHKRNAFGVYAKGGLGSHFHAQVRFKHVELEPTLMASGRAGVALHAEIPKSFSPSCGYISKCVPAFEDRGAPDLTVRIGSARNFSRGFTMILLAQRRTFSSWTSPTVFDSR